MSIFSKLIGSKYIRYLFVFTVVCSWLNTELIAQNNNVEKSEKAETTNSESPVQKFIETLVNTKISDLKKPFADHPGYITDLHDFDLRLHDRDTNKEFRLKDLRGKVVIVFYTTTWCPNCPSVFRDLDQLADKLSQFGIDNVLIIPVVLGNDSENAIRVYYKANNIQLLDVFDPLSHSGTEDVNGVPACIVFNKKCEPVWGFLGIANYRSESFLNFIVELSKED